MEELDGQLVLIESTLAAVEEVGPWLGDKSLQNAVAEGLRTWQELAQRDIRPMLVLQGAGLDSHEEVDSYNAHVRHLNETSAEFYGSEHAEGRSFGWGLAA